MLAQTIAAFGNKATNETLFSKCTRENRGREATAGRVISWQKYAKNSFVTCQHCPQVYSASLVTCLFFNLHGWFCWFYFEFFGFPLCVKNYVRFVIELFAAIKCTLKRVQGQTLRGLLGKNIPVTLPWQWVITRAMNERKCHWAGTWHSQSFILSAPAKGKTISTRTMKPRVQNESAIALTRNHHQLVYSWSAGVSRKLKSSGVYKIEDRFLHEVHKVQESFNLISRKNLKKWIPGDLLTATRSWPTDYIF